ncbi:Probable WRKY transcription factor 41 [Striga hermonthica]|uniref:Probable WRKY transcription factor 41 n=1 Tax=Striga hermonthica TaxID=68872 RepID=A0A9N7MNQ5_STRHE|nr:Probable WRKY transcription factor 41 [Striga hermonthica]
MESGLNCENKKLVDELTQGMERAMQLRVHICSNFPSKAHDLLLQGIISTFENSLLILKWGGPAAQAQVGPPTPAALESSLSAGVSPKSEKVDINLTIRPDHEHAPKKRKSQPTMTEQVRVSSENGLDGPLDDGYSWRKYGQKDILGAKHPRSYYRCTYRAVRNCWAKKQVQRSDDDPTLFEIIYKGTHTCSQPSYIVPKATASPQEQHNQTLLYSKRANCLKVETGDLDATNVQAHFCFPTTFSGTEGENQYSTLPEYQTSNYPPISYNPDIPDSNYLSAVTCQMTEITSGHALSTTTNSLLLEFPTDPVDVDPNFPFYSLNFLHD